MKNHLDYTDPELIKANEHLDVSLGEKLLRQFDNRDKAMRIFEVFILVLLAGITLFSLIRLNQISSFINKNTIDHREQVEKAIDDNAQSGQILLCTTSIPTGAKTEAAVDECYPGGSQAEYFKKLRQ